MKKILNYSFVLLAGLALSLACSKVEEDPTVNNPVEQGADPQAKKVTITVSMLEEGLTKVAFTQDPENPDGKVKLTWEEGDKILVNDTEFTLVSGAGTQTAGFSGDEVSASSYTIAYNGGEFAATQTQAADADTDHLAYIVTLTGVNTYQEVEFSQAWASEHGGSLTQSSIFRLRAQMPAGVAETVSAVKIEARDADDAAVNIFGAGNILTVNLTTPGDADNDGILDIYANLPTTAAAIPSGTAFFVRFKTTDRGDYFSYTRYHVFSSALALTPGKVNALKLNCTATDKHAGLKSYCDGTTAAKAYLIGDAYQMQAMNATMVAGSTRYYKFIDDIDVPSALAWTRLNPDPFTAAVNLDGNNKTVSHLNNALFQDLNGTVANLTIDHSTISSSELLGILACSVQKTASSVNNVDITNGTLNASSSYCGGLIGQSGVNIPLSLSGVHVIGTNITGGLAGGIIGYIQGAATVSDCHFDGGAEGVTITSNAQYTGGITAATANGKTISISDCSVKNATLTSAFHRVGGLIGAMRNGTTVERCNVGESGNNVTITTTGTAACYTGGFIGLMEGGEVKDNCKAYAAVTGVKTSIGGFIGRMTAGKISGCKSYGSVSGPGTIGGFFGDVTGATEIKNNESNCNVSATNTFVGGFVGQFKGSLSCSGCKHKSGKVASSKGSGQIFIGGFAGYIGHDGNNEAFTGTISGCYVESAVVDAVYYENGAAKSSGTWVGGFAGGIGDNTYANNTGKVEKCGVYNTKVSGGQYCGGFAGVSYSTVEKCRVNGAPTIQCYGNTNGGLIAYQQGHSVRYCYTNAVVRHANKSNVGGLIGNAKNTTVEECYSSGNLTNSSSSSDKSGTWGGIIGLEDIVNNVSTVTKTHLIRWNHSNNASISGGETSVPSGCYVKQSSDSNFETIATSLGWSTDGSIWTYPADGSIPTLVGV